MIDRSDISAAMARIAPHIRRTPVLRLAPHELGTEHPVTLKLEFLQVTGSFKPRGAFNRLLSGIRRQSRRGSRLRRAKPWGAGGNLRPRADTCGETRTH
jgi:threonine dehydratase